MRQPIWTVARLTGAALICAGAAATGVWAQAQQTQAPTFRTSVTFVEVDVSVLDNQRRPVRGLQAGEFQVFEDGKPQPVETFTEIKVPDAVEAPTAWMREVEPDVRANVTASDGRLITIVLDDAQVRFTPFATNSVKQIGRRLLDAMGAADQASVIYTSNFKKGQEFTTDRAKLLAAIDRFVPQYTPAAAGIKGDFGPAYFYQQTLSTLQRVCDYLASVPQRRKSLIYVSSGVPVDVSRIATPGAGGDFFDTAGTLRNMLGDLYKRAQKANVNFYSIDPNGLGGLFGETNESAGLSAEAPAAQSLLQDFLVGVSEETGGFPIINSNDFSAGITQIFRENASYYLLGYRSPNPAQDGRTRRLEVRVTRPGLIVRARNSYDAPRPEKAAKSDAPSALLVGAATGVVPKSDVGMQATAIAFPGPGKASAVAVLLGVRQPAPQNVTRITENVDVIVNAFAYPDGKAKGSQRMKATLVLRPGVTSQVQYELMTRLDLEPGRYEIRLAAESRLQGKSGSVFVEVDVPDYGKAPIEMSGVAIHVQPAITAGGQDRVKGFLPFVPTTQRVFDAGGTVTAFTQFTQRKDAPGAIDVTSTIVDSRGATVFRQTAELPREAFNARRVADFSIDLPLARLPPGPYLLTIDAKRRGGGAVHRQTRFGMR